jgi:hypothetical protein
VYTTPSAAELGRYQTPLDTKYVVPLMVVWTAPAGSG